MIFHLEPVPSPYVGTLGSIWRPMRAMVLEVKDNERKMELLFFIFFENTSILSVKMDGAAVFFKCVLIVFYVLNVSCDSRQIFKII